MFQYIESDFAAGREPPEMAIRFAFRYDLLDAVVTQEPLLPVCTAYADRFPHLVEIFEIDFQYELETNFKTDEEEEAEIDQINREEDARRERLSQTHEGRQALLL